MSKGWKEMDLFEVDWKWLVVLDACRYDFMLEAWPGPGRVEARLSPASCTVEFLRHLRPIPGSCVITGHPFLLRRKDLFDHIIDVGFDYDLGTCPPAYITGYVLRNITRLARFKRVVLWYLQPHHPLIADPRACVPVGTPGTQVYWCYKELHEAGILWGAYSKTLKLVVRSVKMMLPMLVETGTVVITSDHGEGLGKPYTPDEEPVYSHPCGRKELEVRLVPWIVIGGGRD